MKHSVATRKELTILKIEEPVFDVRHADLFRETIDQLVSREKSRNLIIDFSQVKAIDSSGISSMLLAHQLANQSEGLAIFVSLCQQIKDLLKLTNLDKQLYIFSSINEVMTLVEPAIKGKRAQRAKAQAQPFEPADELGDDDLELLNDDVFPEEHFTEIVEETGVDDNDTPEAAEPVEEPAPKRRGRPKKTPVNSPGKEKMPG